MRRAVLALLLTLSTPAIAAPDPYTASVQQQDFLVLKGAAMQLFWAAGCGVIGEPGMTDANLALASSGLGQMADYLASQDHYIPSPTQRREIWSMAHIGAAAAHDGVGCSFWVSAPDAVRAVRRLVGE